MTAFSLDENVSQDVVPLLRAAGYIVVTAQGMQMKGASDDAQVCIAWKNRWIIVTQNRGNFLLVHETLRRWAGAWGHTDFHAGILVLPHLLSIREQVRVLDVFAAASLPSVNAYYEWRPNGGWMRR